MIYPRSRRLLFARNADSAESQDAAHPARHSSPRSSRAARADQPAPSISHLATQARRRAVNASAAVSRLVRAVPQPQPRRGRPVPDAAFSCNADFPPPHLASSLSSGRSTATAQLAAEKAVQRLFVFVFRQLVAARDADRHSSLYRRAGSCDRLRAEQQGPHRWRGRARSGPNLHGPDARPPVRVERVDVVDAKRGHKGGVHGLLPDLERRLGRRVSRPAGVVPRRAPCARRPPRRDGRPRCRDRGLCVPAPAVDGLLHAGAGTRTG